MDTSLQAPHELTAAQLRALDALFSDRQFELIAAEAGVPVGQIRTWLNNPGFQSEILNRVRESMAVNYGPVLTALVAGCQRASRNQHMFIRIFITQFNSLFGLRSDNRIINNDLLLANAGDGPPSFMPPAALASLPLDVKLQYLQAIETIQHVGTLVTPIDVTATPANHHVKISLIPDPEHVHTHFIE